MRRCLLAVGILLVSLFYVTEPTHAAEYKTTIINSFETGVEESTTYGSWDAEAFATGGGNLAEVVRTNATQYHGAYSAKLHIVTDGDPDEGALAKLGFTSNTSLDTFMFDSLRISFKFSKASGSDPVGWYDLEQWNATTLLDSMNVDLSLSDWTELVITPLWDPETTYWSLEFLLSEDELQATDSSMYLDYFRFDSGQVDVRVRYWNLYTGLGYYEEKLLARYYSLSEGWIDIWRGEFQAYKEDEILLQVTDIFNRNVWTGVVLVDDDPEYLDILVPIVTVYIPKPDWYNDSVPMEWRITCLPYGPDGLAGMEVPATGFEFEILAGWYSISWLESHYVKAGSQTVYIDGNITAKRSFMLTNISIPINPDYGYEVNGGSLRLGDWNDLVKIAAALSDDFRFKAITGFLIVLTLFGLMWRAHKEGKKRLRGGQR